jgi:cysteinyl-tRNA synthetase
MPKATEHIKEQVALVKALEDKGFTYKTSDGIYFDTYEFEKKTGKKYGELSTLDEIREGARVSKNPEKKNPRDFALWKFSKKTGVRHMEWDSPWGLGFPGWHIECSAMSMKYLGKTFDIHVGGEDLRSTHHPNEIVQSEAATGKPFVKYWVHVTFLQVDGKRMSKSLGNVYTVADIKKKGFDPLALRYLFLTAQYRDRLNFTWDGLTSSQNALDKLRSVIAGSKGQRQRTVLSEENRKKYESFRKKFLEAVSDDLNTSRGLAILWQVLKSNIPPVDKYHLVISFDEVLGLGLSEIRPKRIEEIETKSGHKIFTPVPLSTATISRIEAREAVRSKGDFERADKLRLEISVKDRIQVKDTVGGTVVEPTKE